MNKGVLGAGIILLGAIALLVINIVTNYSTGGEVDYYLLKETSEAAMTDALDESFQQIHGVPRMDTQVFMESFLRRFADNVNDTRSYKIGFYGLNEVPPKVSVKVDSLTVLSFKNEEQQTNGEITTTISQIVETQVTKNDDVKYEIANDNNPAGSPVDIAGDGETLLFNTDIG